MSKGSASSGGDSGCTNKGEETLESMPPREYSALVLHKEKDVGPGVCDELELTGLDELAGKVHDIECLMRKMSLSAAKTDKVIQGIFGALEVGLDSTI